MSGLKAAFQVLHAPWQLGLIISCVILTTLIIRLSFNKLQRIFLFMILFS
jgi:hypothetical protein